MPTRLVLQLGALLCFGFVGARFSFAFVFVEFVLFLSLIRNSYSMFILTATRRRAHEVCVKWIRALVCANYKNLMNQVLQLLFDC